MPIEDVTSGTPEIDGQVVNDIEPKDRGIAMAFQTYAIFPYMTVRENAAFGLAIKGGLKDEKERRVAEATCIPRMDFGKLHQSLKAPMIYVTHDQVEAMTLADRIVVLKDGKVMQAGPPMDLYHEPANLFVAGFPGGPSMNFIPVNADGVEGDHVTISSPSVDRMAVRRRGREFTVGQTATLGVRPQYIRAAAGADGMLHGHAELTERLGSETVVDVALPTGNEIIAALPEDRILAHGTEASFESEPGQAHLFPEVER